MEKPTNNAIFMMTMQDVGRKTKTLLSVLKKNMERVCDFSTLPFSRSSTLLSESRARKMMEAFGPKREGRAEVF